MYSLGTSYLDFFSNFLLKFLDVCSCKKYSFPIYISWDKIKYISLERYRIRVDNTSLFDDIYFLTSLTEIASKNKTSLSYYSPPLHPLRASFILFFTKVWQLVRKKYVLWTFFYLYAYFFFFYFGSILPKIKKRYIWFLALVWGIITFFHANSVWWFFSPEFVLQSMKYSPHMYYNSYAITISSLLFLIMPFFKILRFEPLKFTFSFISSSSLWIYLWHIFPVYILSTYFPDMNFLYKFGLIISFSLSVVILQKGLIIWILECCKVSPEKRKIIIQILCS